MSQLEIGDPLPSFRLPSAQGAELGPEDYRGRSNLILFFAKGMGCGFCRQKMSQLGLGAPRFRSLDAEILMVAPTTLGRGRFYARNFPLPFPYLCDPDYRVFALYGMPLRPRSLLEKAQVLVVAARMPQPEVTELGKVRRTLPELSRALNDDDLGFFIADKAGVVRYASAGPYVEVQGGAPVGFRPIPSNDEIADVLEACQKSTRPRAV